jgi:hypothetical protein
VKKMAAAAAASMGVVCEVLGADIVEEVYHPITDYITNVLAHEDFGFSFPYGHDIFNALGELLIDAGCVTDQDHCLKVLLSIRPTLVCHPHSEIQTIAVLGGSHDYIFVPTSLIIKPQTRIEFLIFFAQALGCNISFPLQLRFVVSYVKNSKTTDSPNLNRPSEVLLHRYV